MSSLASKKQLSVFDFSLASGFKYKIVSTNTLYVYQSEMLNVAWKGSLKYQGKAVTPEELADIYQNNSNIQSLYDQLSGRFWLLIGDDKTQDVYLVNDHLGMELCYYTQQQSELVVSDSLALLKAQEGVSCTLSNQAIYHYFYFHCIPAPETIYTECFKLEPAKAKCFDRTGDISSQNLYHPKFATDCADPEGLQKECLDVIDNAVKDAVADNCGAFLSGGLDSSTVAGMLSRHQDPAKTFSIGFTAKDYDETPYAKLTAEHFGTDHQTLYLEADKAAKAFVKVATYFDEPFGNSSAMAAYFCATFAKEHGVNRLLAGDGGDELFAGNGRYAKQKVFEVFHGAPKLLQSIPRALFTNGVVDKLPVAKKVASYIRQADIPLPERLETYNFINQFGADEMFDSAFLNQIDQRRPIEHQEARYNECESDDPVDKMLYLDWKFTLADNDLVKVSKMCELAGVEVEYPLLDRRVLDFSCKIPAEVKLPGSNLRDFYKKSCKGFLADDTLTKSKHGFGLPFGVWMKENKELRDLTMQCLTAFKKRNIVKDSLIEQALEAHESVHAGYYGVLIWTMVILELWLQDKG